MQKQASRLLIVLALLVAGGAAAQRVASVYENPRMAGKAYAKILVVGAHADADRRRQFENEVVRSLDAQNVDAISTLEMLGADQTINRKVLTAAAHETGADGVLITRLLDAQMSEEASERRDDQSLADFLRDEYAAGRDPMAAGAVRAGGWLD